MEHFKKVIYKLLICLIIPFLICGVTNANDRETPSITPQDWPSSIWNTLRKYTQDNRVQFSNALFDTIDDIRLAKISFASDNANVAIKSKREVYNNHDVLNTWTVIDRFHINLGYNRNISINQSVISAVPDLNFTLGTSTGLEWSHLRLIPKNSAIVDINTESEEIKNSKWFKNLGLNNETPSEDEDLLITPDPLPADPSLKPRFQKTLSRLVTAFKIPRTVKKFIQTLGDGEMVSYYGYGAIEPGVSIDWDFIDDKITQAAFAELSANFYIKGGFKISILKENNRFSRIKISRIFDRGHSRSLQILRLKQELFEGILVFNKNRASYSYVFKPFEITRSKDISRFTDMVFRYDLQDPLALQAFEEALRGRFGLSKKLANQNNDSPTVKEITKRIGRRTSTHKPKNIKLLLFSYKKDRFNEMFEGSVELGENNHQIFKSQNANIVSHRYLWGVSESKTNQFTISIDNKMGAFVTAESFLDDSRTRGTEINQYLKQAELVTGQDNILPRLPPQLGGSRKNPIYGRSSFYFGYHLDPNNLTFLSRVPDTLKREYIINAFKLLKPDSVINESSIETIIKRWDLLKTWPWISSDSRPVSFPEANKILNQIFSEQRFTQELMIAFRLALAGESIDYFVSIQNPVLGRIYERGKFQPDIERLLKQTDAELGFEGVKGQNRANPDASIDEWQVTDYPLSLSFKAHSAPNVIYLSLKKHNSNHSSQKIHERVLINRSKHYKTGWNKINLDSGYADQEIEKEFIEKLEPDSVYSLSIAYSIDKIYWGAPIEIKFKTPSISDKLKN